MGRALNEIRLATRQELETYADYGDAVKNNAKRGIELNKKNGNKCATATGKQRAQQLANGRGISLDTIKRMYNYLNRAEHDYDPNDTKACGTISYLLWGGKSALSWSRNKLRELGHLEAAEQELARELNVNQIAKDLDTMRNRLRKVAYHARQHDVEFEYVKDYHRLIEKTITRFKKNKSNDFDGKDDLVKIMTKYLEEVESAEYVGYWVPIADEANVDLYKTFKRLVSDGKLDY